MAARRPSGLFFFCKLQHKWPNYPSVCSPLLSPMLSWTFRVFGRRQNYYWSSWSSLTSVESTDEVRWRFFFSKNSIIGEMKFTQYATFDSTVAEVKFFSKHPPPHCDVLKHCCTSGVPAVDNLLLLYLNLKFPTTLSACQRSPLVSGALVKTQTAHVEHSGPAVSYLRDSLSFI